METNTILMGMAELSYKNSGAIDNLEVTKKDISFKNYRQFQRFFSLLIQFTE